MSLGAQQIGVSVGAQHTQASLGAVPTGCAVLLGSGPAPGSLFALRGGVDLQAVPSLWPCEHGFVWFSSPTPGCLQSPMGEDTLPDLLTPWSFCSALTLSWLEATVPCLPHNCAGPH